MEKNFFHVMLLKREDANDQLQTQGQAVHVYIWAHQSTYNPNMPVRELMYLGKLYDKFIHQRKENIFGKKLIKLPIPKIVVFYNGKEKKEEETVLALSDAFPSEVSGVESDVEVRVRMININKGYNRELMSACKPLSEYAWFIEKIREYSGDYETEEAVDLAIDEMPEGFLIKGFLVGHRAEVKDMCITEYNEAETMQLFREEGREEGRAEGMLEKAKQVYRNCLARGMSEEDAMAISGLKDAQIAVE